ncbi:MAG: hypothetical protein KKB25_02755, partial [Nanoarchaeota archaeon]|nr:hypothetical protein [Nanoarchaeota archaeon]
QALSVSVFAITAAPIVHNATQPNGFEFCLIVVGDEHVRSVYLADCNLSFDENLGGAEIYEGTDGYWRFKSNDTIIDNDGKAGIQNNGNKDYENQDLKTSIIIAVILIAAVLVAFKFRNKIFKKK